MTVYVFEVPLRTPSLNAFNRGHWRGYYDLKKRWQTEFQVARMKARLFGRPQFPKAVLLFERFAVQPILDTDNRVGGLKPVIDAMVDNGLLLADDDAHLAYAIEEVRVAHRAEERTRVTMWVGEDLAETERPMRRLGEPVASSGQDSEQFDNGHVVDFNERRGG